MGIEILCAGSNANGQLSTGDVQDRHALTPALSDPSLKTASILNISGGSNHTLVLLETVDGAGSSHTQLWGCGDGRKGQLGPSYDVHREPWSIFRPIELNLGKHGLAGYTVRLAEASWETSYLVLSSPGKSDALLSMGSNDYGDLGVGISGSASQNQRTNLVQFHHLLQGECTGDLTKINALATGLHHVVVLLEVTRVDGSRHKLITGWGMSRQGQLGDISQGNRLPPFVPTPYLLTTDPTLGRVISASLGHQHTALLHDSGRISAYGSNRKTQLRDLEHWRNVKAIGCTWNGTYAITERHGALHICSTGDNNKGQLGFSDGFETSVRFPFTSASHRLLDIACGSEHILCLFQIAEPCSSSTDPSDQSYSTEVWGWGWNEHGNLGLGTTEDVPIPRKIWPTRIGADSKSAPDGNAKAIWAGCATSWIAIEW